MSTKSLWGGRFTGAIDPLMHEFNQSFSYDQRMYKADLLGSQAYAAGLEEAGILTPDERAKIHEGLDAVLQEWTAGTFTSVASDEDIHTANERRLGELIGPLAGKLHTGRSRNDQVTTDMRLWMLETITDLRQMLVSVISTMASRAEVEVAHIMPGYTHLQRAQPIRWSHFLLSHAAFLLSDLSRLDSLTPRVSVLPLGSGAMAGNPFAVPREKLAQKLGFQSLSINSMQAVADRDFIVEFLFWSSMVMLHISKLAEDLIIYSSAEFAFVTLSDAYSTGSSIMPQKKNADSLELLRGKSGRTFGQLSGFMMTLKGLPSTYDKDLQEDKEPLFDCADTISRCLRILEGVMSTMTIYPENMRKALTPDLLATDLAEYLVRKGMPFRETHHISGACVRLAEESKVSLSELTLEQLRSVCPKFDVDTISEVFDFEKSVERRDVYGGPAKRRVLEQVAVIRQSLS